MAALAALIGIVLAAIGVRFALAPLDAARFFGVGGPGVYATAFHHMVAARDLWLGLLALALAIGREWRALSIWLALGALVCVADAMIAQASAAHLRSISFHVASGVLCGWLAAMTWRLDRRQRAMSTDAQSARVER